MVAHHRVAALAQHGQRFGQLAAAVAGPGHVVDQQIRPVGGSGTVRQGRRIGVVAQEGQKQHHQRGTGQANRS